MFGYILLFVAFAAFQFFFFCLWLGTVAYITKELQNVDKKNT